MGTPFNSKWKLGTILPCLICFIIGTFFTEPSTIELVSYPNTGRLYVTADHINPKDVKNMEKVYSSSECDYAVYVQNNYKPSSLKIGGRVLVDGNIPGKIIADESNTFTVKVDDWEDIRKGLSGTRVTLIGGKEIGFVSSVSDVSELTCVRF